MCHLNGGQLDWKIVINKVPLKPDRKANKEDSSVLVPQY